MASKTTYLFLSLNLLFFALVTGQQTCPTLQLGVCAGLLNLVNVTVGSPPTMPCCSLVQGLVDLQTAVCLCTAIRANVLGIINLNATVPIKVIFSACGRTLPADFTC
ncbi:hypothetical protein R3W88_008592 [Solanum pinnatisectum]|uniref:Bifunctional inhibitor/plant lipid transfer protein/seed storage helical domain-containing protein n=1 Tax=Solanum pinnatisectum TaxID=50273 RepID=A0AAV9M8T7_9SOLN|nr:hypothetical protein R3W88_008592 [Solanum pinnatisectum]